jgi:hypothetical protein
MNEIVVHVSVKPGDYHEYPLKDVVCYSISLTVSLTNAAVGQRLNKLLCKFSGYWRRTTNAQLEVAEVIVLDSRMLRSRSDSRKSGTVQKFYLAEK